MSDHAMIYLNMFNGIFVCCHLIHLYRKLEGHRATLEAVSDDVGNVGSDVSRKRASELTDALKSTQESIERTISSIKFDWFVCSLVVLNCFL